MDLNLKAIDMRTFIPSGENYERGISFYQEIGFELEWRSEAMAGIKKDNCRFFLQNIPNEWIKDNFMMTLEVEDIDAWWTKLSQADLEKKYPEVRMKAPQEYPWGWKEIHR
jgi:hypothetical protein